MEYEVEGPRLRGRPKRTWKEVVKEDCLARKLNKEDAIDRSKWRKLIKDVRWSGWVWVGECFLWYWPTWVVLDQRPLNGCVCVRACVCARARVRICKDYHSSSISNSNDAQVWSLLPSFYSIRVFKCTGVKEFQLRQLVENIQPTTVPRHHRLLQQHPLQTHECNAGKE